MTLPVTERRRSGVLTGNCLLADNIENASVLEILSYSLQNAEKSPYSVVIVS